MLVSVLEHPLIKHKMSLLREKETSTADFRQIAREISTMMVYEVTKDFPLELREIETPIAKTNQPFIQGKKVAIIPILRAGLGMVDGMLEVLPNAKVGHVGMYRNEETLEAVEYFAKFPTEIDQRMVILTDPMLATGGTANSTITLLKERGVKRIKLVCLLGCEEGVKAVEAKHPDVDIYLAACDEELNSNGYIVPGLGDAGDRLYGTK